MPTGRYKSRTFRRIKVRTPGGKTVTHYKLRMPAKAKCGKCGMELKGVARARPNKMKNMPKTAKRPTRPYGGNLCSKCTRSTIVKKIQE